MNIWPQLLRLEIGNPCPEDRADVHRMVNKCIVDICGPSDGLDSLDKVVVRPYWRGIVGMNCKAEWPITTKGWSGKYEIDLLLLNMNKMRRRRRAFGAKSLDGRRHRMEGGWAQEGDDGDELGWRKKEDWRDLVEPVKDGLEQKHHSQSAVDKHLSEVVQLGTPLYAGRIRRQLGNISRR